jgi:signal peptidase I
MHTESQSTESCPPADTVRAERSDEGSKPSSRRPHRIRRRSLRLLLCALITMSLLVALRLAAVEGLFSVIRIEGGSMAELLCGDHLVVSCEDCGFAFRMDIATRSTERRICPNCGFANAPSDRDTLGRGRCVMIDHWPSWTRHLSRGDLVAVRDPDHPDEKAVKRVVGLPNERIEVRDGDLYANGVLVRSSFSEYRSRAMLVHDDRFRPQRTSEAPSRWVAEYSALPWNPVRDGYHFASQEVGFEASGFATENTPSGWAWLEYHHWRCCESPKPRFDDAPILDNDPYNQAVSRVLHPVHDIGVSCVIASSAGAELAFRIRSASNIWELRLTCDGTGVELFRDETLVEKAKLTSFLAQRDLKAQVAICDRQFFFAANDRLILAYQFDDESADVEEERRPIAIGVYRGSDAIASQVTVRVRDVQVWRDRHYLGPRRSPERWAMDQPLPADCFAVLGDNPPLSIDSREWPRDAVSWRTIVGRVIPHAEAGR